MFRGLSVLLLVVTAQIAWAGEVHVSAYYYPWYRGQDDSRFDRTLRSKLVPPQAPELGRYDSNDEAAVEQHRAWSREYGIDTWICYWNGSERWEDYIIHRRIAVKEGDSQPTFAILYDSVGRLTYRRGMEMDRDNAQQLRTDMNYIARMFFLNDNYQRIDGRPVVYLYLSREYTGDVAGTIRRIRRDMLDIGRDIFLVGDEIDMSIEPDVERLRLFDGITSSGMFDGASHDGYPVETGYVEAVKKQFARYKAAADAAGVMFMPNVMPGFNNHGVRPHGNTAILPRRVSADAADGSTLAALCGAVTEVMGDSDYHVTVSSWNNWGEDTQVEPEVESESTSDDTSEKQAYTDGYAYSGTGTRDLEILKEKFEK
jgi:glycoprotein endo-alpha-1,2-mannosidase